MRVVYPVLLEYDGDAYTIQVPDLDLIEYGSEIYDLLDGTREDISLAVMAKEHLGKEIPEPTLDLEPEAGQLLLFLPVNTEDYVDMISEHKVVAEIVLPVELAELIAEARIPLDELIAEALKKKKN